MVIEITPVNGIFVVRQNFLLVLTKCEVVKVEDNLSEQLIEANNKRILISSC